MKVRFLLDENVTPRLAEALRRHDPAIDVARVGDGGAPRFGTADPEILRYVERDQRILVTGNRVSMPPHASAHLAAGGHHWGVLRLRPSATFRQVVEDLYLIWEASEAEEWIDLLRWLPL